MNGLSRLILLNLTKIYPSFDKYFTIINKFLKFIAVYFLDSFVFVTGFYLFSYSITFNLGAF